MVAENSASFSYDISMNLENDANTPAAKVSVRFDSSLDPSQLTFGDAALPLEQYLASDSVEPATLAKLKKQLG